MKLIYGRLGFGERVDLFESDEEHGFTRPRRVATVRWMRRWLLKQDDAVDEPDFPIATDADLQCTRTGQVLRDFKEDVSVFDLNRQREATLRVARDAANQGRSIAEFRNVVRKRIRLSKETARPLKPQVVSTTRGKGFAVRKLVFEVEPGIALPAIDITREGRADGGPTVVKVGVNWKEELASEKETEKIPSPGRLVLFDPRGLGETSPTPGPGRPSPFGDDWKEAYMAVHLDRPLLGQRVADLLQVLEGLDAESAADDHPGFHRRGSGLGRPDRLACGTTRRARPDQNVTLERSLVSWADIVQKGISRNQFA